MSAELLSVERYRSAEQAALASVPNRIIECSRPVTFAQVGYPVEVSDERGLARFVDVMHELRFETDYADLLGGFTRDEFGLFQRINEALADLAEQRYGRRLVARGALGRSIHILRYVRMLYPEGATVLEVGPGSGFLGALLMLSGYAYVGTDVAPAFYVVQSHVLALAGPVLELATSPQSLADLTALEPGSAAHVPWWKYVTPAPALPLAVDCVTCNHALCEMHPVALAYNLELWRALLERPGGHRALLFNGWGSNINTPIWAVGKRFYEHGFVFAHNDQWISAYVPRGTPAAEHARSLPNPEQTPNARIDLAAYGARGFERIYQPPIHIDDRNPLSAAIRRGREALAREPRVPYADVHGFLVKTLGQPDLRTDDERFRELVRPRGPA